MTTVKQLFEILQKHNRLDLLAIDTTVTIENGKLVPKPRVTIDENDKISFQYYFWYHLDREFPKSKVLKAIEEKDFAAFCAIYNDWYFKHNLTYMPDYIHIFDEDKDESIGAVSGIWLKDIFELIDFAEYECG